MGDEWRNASVEERLEYSLVKVHNTSAQDSVSLVYM